MLKKLRNWLKGMDEFMVFKSQPPPTYGVIHVPSREIVLEGVTKEEACKEVNRRKK